MLTTERASLVQALVPLARRAAELILEVYATPFEVIDKGGDDPVTVADRRSNTLLCEGIEALFPGVPLVAEESDPSSFLAYTSAPAAFFIDPLDGTREFVARNGEFVVMVGFAEHGRATAGLVLAPVSGLIWTGAVGHGAEEIRPDGTRVPLVMSDSLDTLTDARVVVSRSRRAPPLEALLRRLPPREQIPLGSAGLKATAVARGQADAYIQLAGAGCLWDTGAPEAIVTAAGGRFTHADGSPVDYRGQLEVDRGVVVAAPRLHDAILRSL